MIKMVALDAGHGGDRGARGNGLIEDRVCLDLVTRIGHHLRASGLQTILTRTTDAFVPLERRTAIAMQAKANLFFSIHINAGSTAAEGLEAFIAVGDTRSQKVAKKVLEATNVFEELHHVKDRGVKPDNASQHSSLYVLQHTKKLMPAVLMEVLFITSVQDSKLLSQPKELEELSTAIAKGIVDALN